MATPPLLPVSMKLEDGAEPDEQNGNVSTKKMSSSSVPQAAGEAASHSVQNVLPPPSLNEGSLLALPPEKAVLSSYPPGCPVLHINANEAPPLITFGVVRSVSIDLTSRSFVYSVASTGTGNTIVSPESQLQWAPSCGVWACLSSNGTEHSVWKPSIVLTAYQPSPQSPPLFSLQDDGPSGALFHGIPKEYIRYRPASSVTPVGSASGSVAPVVNNEEAVSHATAATFVLQTPVVNEEPVSDASRRLSLVSNQSRASETMATVSTPQVERSREEAATGFVPAVIHEDLASRASHRLSLVSNHSISSRGTEVVAAVSTPAVRRPNDTEIEQPPAKRVKTNEGRPSAWRSARNSDEVANPVGSVVQFRANNETCQTIVNRDISTRRRNKTQATAAEEDSANDETREEDLFALDFVIPGCVFDVETIRDFVRVNRKKINRETDCDIRLLIKGREDSNRPKGMYLELTGTREQITAAQHAVERYLIASVNEQEKGRVLYFMALVNNHRSKYGKVVFQYCYHHKKPGMKYMLCQMLPRDCQEIIGYVIGKKGRRKKDLEKKMNCKIEIKVDCDKPHFVIYGNTHTDVRECGQLVHEQYKQGQGRHM